MKKIYCQVISGSYKGCIGTILKSNESMVYFYPLDTTQQIVKHISELGPIGSVEVRK